MDNLICGLDTDLSKPIYTGMGSILPIEGWCYHRRLSIKQLDLIAGTVSQRIRHHSEARPDILRQTVERGASIAGSVASGFRLDLPLPTVKEQQSVVLALRARMEDGSDLEAQIGTITLLPDSLSRAIKIESSILDASQQPLVVICLTTYNPPIEFLKRQLQSISQQTYRHWVCIINDDCSDADLFAEVEHLARQDARFIVCRNDERLGFYHNVEKCLTLVPRQAHFVALADQDDDWYPTKLERTLQAFRDGVSLVYCDMEIVSKDGELIAPSFWMKRPNNYKSLWALLLVNTITGAASMFRAELLRDLLPFPPRLGETYHDHWIACTAAVLGRLAFIDTPLYGYRQHGGNIIGYVEMQRAPILLGLAPLRQWFFDQSLHHKARFEAVLWQYRKHFDYLRGRIVFARTLLLRARHLSLSRQLILRTFIASGESLAVCLIQATLFRLLRPETMGVEWAAFYGLLAQRLTNAFTRRHQAQMLQVQAGAVLLRESSRSPRSNAN